MSAERKYVNLSDWLAVRGIGLDPGLRPPGGERATDPALRLAAPPQRMFPAGFGGLYDKPPTAAERRSAYVDGLLAELGIR